MPATHSSLTGSVIGSGGVGSGQVGFTSYVGSLNECRRFPQVVRTAPDYWCGEFKPTVEHLKKTLDMVDETPDEAIEDMAKERGLLPMQ